MAYNKLVRDNIPAMIKQEGKGPVTRLLNDKECVAELKKKLIEESLEVSSADEKHIKEELADVWEVFTAIIKVSHLSLDEVKDAAVNKRMERGGFDQKIFLTDVK